MSSDGYAVKMFLSDHLRQLEEQLLDPVLRKSREHVANLLADDFVEFGVSGRIFHKDDILLELASESAATLKMVDFGARQIAGDAFLVTYSVHRDSAEGPPQISLRSSIWILRDARWQMLFHQGTKAI